MHCKNGTLNPNLWISRAWSHSLREGFYLIEGSHSLKDRFCIESACQQFQFSPVISLKMILLVNVV
jgi:hypothetical protein